MPTDLPFADAIPDRIIWVSPDGDDSNSGSQDSPIHSIQLAMDRAAPGTAILLQPGTYTGNFEFQSIQGTTDKPIWLAAADGPGTVTIVAASNDAAVITIQGEDNIVIRDLNISGGYSGIQVSQSGSNYTDIVNNIWIEGNTISGSVVDGLKISQTTNIHVVNNVIDNTGGEGIDFVGVINGVIAGNEISHTHGAAGLFVKGGSSDISITDNYVHNVLGDGIDVGGWSSFLYPGTNYEAKNVTVTGNVVDDASRRPLGVLGGQNVDIHDNFFGTISTNTYAVFVGTGGPELSAPPVSKNVSIHDNMFDRSTNFSMVQSGSTGIKFVDNIKNGVIEGDMRTPGVDPVAFADTLPGDLMDAAAWPTSARYTHTVTGNASANNLTGTAGNDYLAGGGGNDTMAGGQGDDTYEIGSTKDLAVEQAGQGADTAQVWTSSYTLAANVENLFVKTTGGGTFIGNELDNIFTSGRGNDVFTGGTGDDLFVFAPGRGHDTMTDFNPGAASRDTIDLTAFTSLVSFADVLAAVSQAGANTVLSFDTGETLTLANVAVGSLTADDFMLTRVPPPPNVAPNDVSLSNGEVAEGAAIGTVVGILSATDADGGETFTYTLADDPSGLFTIDGDHLVVAGALDFETAASHTVTVRVTDSANNTFDKVLTVDVADVAPSAPADTDEAENIVDGGAATGTVVGITAAAADPNGGALTYALLDDAGGRFAIDASTGVVTVADGSLIDYANAQEHTIAVQASDPSGATTTTGFTVAVAPPPPNVAPTDVALAGGAVLEDAAVGTVVGTLSATDANGGETFTYTLADDPSGLFAIDGDHLIVARAPDFETAASHTVTVRVTDLPNNTFDKVLTVDIADVAPSAPVDADEAENIVDNGAATGTVVGITASAADPNGGALTYALLDDADGRFAIDASTGVVTVADGSLIAYADAQEHAITVQASDASGAATTTSFTIVVAPLPNEPIPPSTPEDLNVAANVVLEGATAGQLVGISVAAAVIGGGAVAYSLLDDAGGRFAIDAATGVVTVANGSLLDYKSATGHAILVRATGADGATSEATFTIDVANVSGSTITGGTANDTIDGTHTVVGQSFASGEEDVIKGGAGSDTIEGLGGGDTLTGGAGTDTLTYAHGQAGLWVSLATGFGHGGDAEGDVISEFENLTGSAYDDVLEGNGGNNRLNGGAGVDTLTYEHATGSIRLSLAVTTTSQTTGGAGGDLVTNFENLTGSNFNDFLTGDAGDNVLSGLSGNDVINGAAGNDTLIGGYGKDTLTGGAGADTFVFNFIDERIDTITDFSSGIDRLQISAAGFGGGLVAGDGATLSVVTDMATASAEFGHGYFIYDNSGTDAGTLYWDPTGGASNDAVAFAVLQGTAALSASDFYLV